LHELAAAAGHEIAVKIVGYDDGELNRMDGVLLGLWMK
jgi:hypothetical protein